MRLNFKDLIIFENDDYILINKPPHVASLDERQADNSLSILRMAKEYANDAQLCHRLDKETSGVLAIAKNPVAYRHLSMQFEHRQVEKRYHAVVNGTHDFEMISVYLPIAPKRDGTMVAIDRQKGKEADTIFNTMKVYRNHTIALESRPAPRSSSKIMAVVVDFPLVPVTATVRWVAVKWANSSERCSTGTPRAWAAATSGTVSSTAVDTTSAAQSPFRPLPSWG